MAMLQTSASAAYASSGTRTLRRRGAGGGRARNSRTTHQVRRSGSTQCRAEAVPLRSGAEAGGDGGAKLVIAVTGATGFVGKKLVETLLAEGHEVRILTRNSVTARIALPQAALRGAKFYAHDSGASGAMEWSDAVKGCTGVVNLAGAPISDPWNEDYKKVLVKSRLAATKRISDAINRLPEGERPNLVSSSAVGYYGISDNDTFDEDSRPGNDFLAKLCVQWEEAALMAQTANTTVIRTGVVLEKGGGALGKILPIFQLFAGGPLGSGEQWLSWIHRDDLVGIIMAALKDPATFSGVLNATAPEPTTMGGLCDAVALALNRPNWLPVPGFAVKALLGEGATVVLDGQRVLPKKTEALGYQFQYPTVDKAMAAIAK